MLRTAVVTVLIAAAFGSKCNSPQLTSSSSHSTTDGFFHFHTSFVTEFTFTCGNGGKTDPYFAVVDGDVYSVAYADEADKYQVSWSREHSEAAAQTFKVDVYDEEGISAFQKGSSAKPLFSLEHYHSGLTRKAPISSETVALLVFIVALYYAIKQKSDIIH